MNSAGDAARAQRGTGCPGLLEKLVATARADFRVEVLVIDPADPVFGGPPCRVDACERAARLHDLCEGHNQRWQRPRSWPPPPRSTRKQKDRPGRNAAREYGPAGLRYDRYAIAR